MSDSDEIPRKPDSGVTDATDAGERSTAAFRRLTAIMVRLRRECPWDRRQTHESLRRYLLEECHEVLEALDSGDGDELRGELGDLLFQVWFHAEVASEAGGHGFDIADVVHGIADKLERRHPHVFGDERAGDAAAVKSRWEDLKQKEGRRSRLDGVPRELPALLASTCLQEKAASAGFDWPDIDGPIAKVKEEVDEFLAEVPMLSDDATSSSRSTPPTASPELVHEFGDVLFSLVNVARHLGIDSESALREANRRFSRRFRHIEDRVREEGRDMRDLSLEELDAHWNDGKRSGL